MTVTAEQFTFLANMLREKSAISIGPGKEYLVESRLTPVAKAIGLPDLSALIDELQRPFPNATVRDRVIEAMTTNETSFFRDHHPFDTLRTHVLPDIIKANQAVRRLSIWSAASSTGQELYSIAMLLDMNFPELADWDITLVGTDLSTDVLEKARAGRFSPLEVNRGLPAPMMARYFTRDGAQYVIDEKLRKWCSFEKMNLAEPWPPMPLFDIVFCRNVLIYFELDVRQNILQRIHRSLATGGYLYLGGSESTVGVTTGFEPIRVGNTVVYRMEA